MFILTMKKMYSFLSLNSQIVFANASIGNKTVIGKMVLKSF